jgi:cytochrome b
MQTMDEAKQNAAARGGWRMVSVWDLPVRLFHWTLVGLVIASFVTAKVGGSLKEYHLWSGYAILTLVLFRILWGFAGSTHARFADFVRGPAAVIGYARALAKGDAIRCRGHGPLGGWGIVGILVALLVQAVTGLFASDDIATEGPLVRWVSEDTSAFITRIHNWNEVVLIVMVSLHLTAIAYYAWVRRENLVASMITGKKLMPSGESMSEPLRRGTGLAAVLLALCAAAVWAVVSGK